MIPNYAYRAIARKIIKPVLQVLIVLALVATLPQLISLTVTELTQSDPNIILNDFMLDAQELTDPSLSAAEILLKSQEALVRLQAALNEYLPVKAPIYLGMTLLNALLSPALAMGLYNGIIRALRGKEVTVAQAWPGWKRFFKGIGVSVMIYLLILLRMLPLTLAGVVVYVLLPNSFGMLIYTAALIAGMVLSIRAAYAYSMAAYILAEAPDTGVMAAIRRSRDAMQGRRMQLFSLQISFILWSLLISFAQTMFLALFGTVIALTVGMFASLFLELYRASAEIVFYDAHVIKNIRPGQSYKPDIKADDSLTDEDENDGN